MSSKFPPKEIGSNPLHINSLAPNSRREEIGSAQPPLDLGIERDTDVGGIGMGVLSDGTPYLNQRGLAQLCGVMNAHIGTISAQWNEDVQKPRIQAIKDILEKMGGAPSAAHIEVLHRGTINFCYPADVCSAVVEYYALDAGSNCKAAARDNYRRLAGSKLREMIYAQVGYDPNAVPRAWQQFHDRVTAAYGDIPAGYFTVFGEVADIIVTLIRHGADVGAHFVPDASVGQHWAKHWNARDLSVQFGQWIPTNHNYPHYFPQARSNPQVVHAYPDAALPAFRRWVREVYLPEKLPGYLTKKVKAGSLTRSFQGKALYAFGAGTRPLIE